jgi:RNase P subunit RPR2
VWQNWEANLIATDRDWYMLSFAYQVLGDKGVHVRALPDYPGYNRDKECDKALVNDLWQVFDQADILVAHNIAFDVKKSNARFLHAGLKPPSPYKSVCTLKIARSQFKLSSNKLDDIGRYLKLGRKLAHTGAHLWFSCMSGDARSWALMKRYNAQDVKLLHDVYLKLRPWHSNHPDLNVYNATKNCPSCESPKVQKRGTIVKLNSKRVRMHCQSCGSWFSAEKV